MAVPAGCWRRPFRGETVSAPAGARFCRGGYLSEAKQGGNSICREFVGGKHVSPSHIVLQPHNDTDINESTAQQRYREMAASQRDNYMAIRPYVKHG